MMTKEDGFADSEEMVLQNTDLTEVTKIEKFNGNEPYHIVYGHTNENESKLVFVPLKKDGELKIIKESKIISKNEMEERLYSSCKSCRLIKITPAIIDNRLLWEVTYKDSRNRYVFDYRLIDKGELFEQFKLSSIYD